MTFDPKFIINRQGKDFVLYNGLVDYATRECGLSSIDTVCLTQGTKENGNLWWFKATVRVERGTFTGHGDASDANVNPMVRLAVPRMAETRAKARALRDATNAGYVVFEELGPDGTDPADAPINNVPTPTPMNIQDGALVARLRKAVDAAKAEGFPVPVPPSSLTNNDMLAWISRIPKYVAWCKVYKKAVADKATLTDAMKPRFNTPDDIDLLIEDIQQAIVDADVPF